MKEINGELTNPKAVDFESETGRSRRGEVGVERVKSLESEETRDIASSTHAFGD